MPSSRGDGARVLVVLGGGAVGVVLLLPVAHEETMHVAAVLLQEQGRDRGVDAAGQPDDDAATGSGGDRSEARHAGNSSASVPAAGARPYSCAVGATVMAVSSVTPLTAASSWGAPTR